MEKVGYRLVLGGLLSYTSLRHNKTSFLKRGATEVHSARYYYSVWLRHLVLLHRNGLTKVPAVVTELGPGDALGSGIAALLCGANRYYALDALEFSSPDTDLRILDDLVGLFKNQEDIPDESEFPFMRPQLDSYKFPSHILSKDDLSSCLADERIQAIREALLNRSTNREIQVTYIAPWQGTSSIKPGSVDLIFSQAVLEHVDYLEDTYSHMHAWLKPGGMMSHQIDFNSHGLSRHWNGHWGYSSSVWKLIRGKRPFWINRAPYSTHAGLHQRHGLEVLEAIKEQEHGGMSREGLASNLRPMSDEDFTTATAHVISRHTGSAPLS